MNDRQLLRRLLIAELIKLVVLGALWKAFIADHKLRVKCGKRGRFVHTQPIQT